MKMRIKDFLLRFDPNVLVSIVVNKNDVINQMSVANLFFLESYEPKVAKIMTDHIDRVHVTENQLYIRTQNST